MQDTGCRSDARFIRDARYRMQERHRMQDSDVSICSELCKDEKQKGMG
jgi:hypothetical protein